MTDFMGGSSVVWLARTTTDVVTMLSAEFTQSSPRHPFDAEIGPNGEHSPASGHPESERLPALRTEPGRPG
jgi:hypothetical protein